VQQGRVKNSGKEGKGDALVAHGDESKIAQNKQDLLGE
jgi:hypothetical protein